VEVGAESAKDIFLAIVFPLLADSAQDSFLDFAFSTSLALALAEVDKTTVGSLTADGATDTTGVGSGCANNDGLACDKKSNIGTCSSWLNPMKAVGVKARLMKYIRGNQCWNL
nr:hypothetical protein [Tanacetum cinerariifolium]